MIWERKYGVATEVYGVCVTAGAALFKENPTRATGDFKISKDGGAFANLTTLPTVSPASGRQLKYALSDTEMQCKTAMIIQVDVSGDEWEDSAIIIETYGHADARHLLDRTEAMRGTDNAGTAIDLATVDTVVDAIKTITDNLPNSGALTDISTSTDRLTAVRAAILTDWIDGGRLDLILDVLVTVVNSNNWHAIQNYAHNQAILADTNELQTDWKDGGRLDNLLDAIPTTAMRGTNSAALASVCTEGRLAELDGANIPTDVDAILADTGTDGVKLNATQPTGWASNLAASAGQVIQATVDTDTNSHTPTTTEFQADDITEATADHYNGRIVIFTSGALVGQAKDITAYEAVGGIGQLTVTALTEAPANNDTFVIV